MSASSIPSFCSVLSQDIAIKNLSMNIDALAGTSNASAKAGVLSAAQALESASANAPASVRSYLISAAHALTTLASDGTDDSAAVDQASQALTSLGNEVQPLCHFQLD